MAKQNSSSFTKALAYSFIFHGLLIILAGPLIPVIFQPKPQNEAAEMLEVNVLQPEPLDTASLNDTSAPEPEPLPDEPSIVKPILKPAVQPEKEVPKPAEKDNPPKNKIEQNKFFKITPQQKSSLDFSDSHIRPAELIKNPAPNNMKTLIKKVKHPHMKLYANITAKGFVDSALVNESSGDPSVDEAIVQNIKQTWAYKPALNLDTGQYLFGPVEIEFDLIDPDKQNKTEGK